MKDEDGKIYAAVPADCGLIVAIEVPDNMTEAETMAQFQLGRLWVLFATAPVVIVVVLALLWWR